ncbi:hypothetical protein [Coxiella endosymbiont of Ornithodoros maritimus]|uniref:hypothetical protein n=1 Tax=Coxiella endosymbiont of Ornithodoros maritimus TaxID=1656172 RepID=UPI0022649D9D|nr:hypothetical protein [Coxiella endosymbiont of Ornithodoros maritimus]
MTHSTIFHKRKLNPFRKGTYDVSDLFKHTPIPTSYPSVVGPLIRKFLVKIQGKYYWKRPATDEVLRFFTTLNKISLLMGCIEEGKKYNSKGLGELDPPLTKLILLASGYWKEQPIGLNCTFEHFDFDNNKDFCPAFIKLNEKNFAFPLPILLFINSYSKNKTQGGQFLSTLSPPAFYLIKENLFKRTVDSVLRYFLNNKIVRNNDLAEIFKECNSLLISSFSKPFHRKTWCSFFGNRLHSKFGRKVFNHNPEDFNEIITYVQSRHDGAT